MLSFSVDAQNLSTKEVSEAYAEAMKSDVTMFLGIPVDGTVSSMKQKLIAKGFKQDSNMLSGQFKCLEENRKVCPCIVCSNFDEYNGECQKNCKIGDIPCKDFIMYRFIRTYISSKYKDAKVKVTSLTPAKEEGTLELRK